MPHFNLCIGPLTFKHSLSRQTNQSWVPCNCDEFRQHKWGFNGKYKLVVWIRRPYQIFVFRLMPPIYSLVNHGMTTVSSFLLTWHRSTASFRLNGLKKYGDRTRSSKMPNKWLSKGWPFQTITCGCITARRSCTWWSECFNLITKRKIEKLSLKVFILNLHWKILHSLLKTMFIALIIDILKLI